MNNYGMAEIIILSIIDSIIIINPTIINNKNNIFGELNELF